MDLVENSEMRVLQVGEAAEGAANPAANAANLVAGVAHPVAGVANEVVIIQLLSLKNPKFCFFLGVACTQRDATPGFKNQRLKVNGRLVQIHTREICDAFEGQFYHYFLKVHRNGRVISGESYGPKKQYACNEAYLELASRLYNAKMISNVNGVMKRDFLKPNIENNAICKSFSKSNPMRNLYSKS
ncbi:hypothetical protein DAPPUDRAFT_332276 [Daphnia pulex]|uniref:Uncharacterized protein n=1 Tax=Daphnia pulex TaxID=6669 RepID=E9HPH8_DAPPU|nr:hypothetical protein DAPPUDRAFT_332276 [Daphnia pulex]|eukprot:EFX66361.1 hypothetical protein DAPPUDRAFT_332276 [Daphnia pulex]